MPVQFNVIISGSSVSGNLDTLSQALTISMSNSDRIGYAHFMLQNKDSSYSKLTGVSGNATISIDAIPAAGITQTVFRGNIEQVVPMIDAQAGSQVEVHAYDYGQELLGLISPDARQPSLWDTVNNHVSLVSGEQGMNAPNGMDLAIYTSGVQYSSGANLSAYLCQFFGRSGDSSGSFSGVLFSFKPHVSGYTWKTYYYPDASGGVLTNDNNSGFRIPLDTHKVKREYAWDALRRLTRQGVVLDINNKKVALESYIGVSGDIHVFTSGSYEFMASGAGGIVTLQYYATGQSGSILNNIVKAKLPNDTTNVKNEIAMWFPAQTSYPLDRDTFTDFVAYSGKFWSGTVQGGTSSITMSGGPPASTVGMISIQLLISGAGDGTSAVNWLMFSGRVVNLNSYNVVQPLGGTFGVSLNFDWYVNSPGQVGAPTLYVVLYDDGLTNFIRLSGTIAPNGSGWTTFTLPPIFASGGAFNSGAWTGSATFPNLSKIKQATFQTSIPLPAGAGGYVYNAIDNMYFSFNYPFSPVIAFNSGSAGMYGRRYAVVDYPYQVAVDQASGLVTNELNSRMGSKQVGDLTIKDNPGAAQSVQLSIKPGQVFVIDAPSMNTGSGQTFYYWRAIDVTHEWSTNKGFMTNLRVVPWFSGTLVDPASNLVDYQLPLQYVQPQPPPDHNLFMPGNPYVTLV